jgi:hypothetical protein
LLCHAYDAIDMYKKSQPLLMNRLGVAPICTMIREYASSAFFSSSQSLCLTPENLVTWLLEDCIFNTGVLSTHDIIEQYGEVSNHQKKSDLPVDPFGPEAGADNNNDISLSVLWNTRNTPPSRMVVPESFSAKSLRLNVKVDDADTIVYEETIKKNDRARHRNRTLTMASKRRHRHLHWRHKSNCTTMK